VSPVLLSSFYIFHYVFYERINGWMDEKRKPSGVGRMIIYLPYPSHDGRDPLVYFLLLSSRLAILPLAIVNRLVNNKDLSSVP